MKRTTVGRARLLALGCLSMTAALATAEEPPAQAQDYAKGFAQFAKFGLPNVATATYVRIDGCWPARIEAPLPYDYESSGNAWMLVETRGTNGRPLKGTFVVNGGEVIVLDWDSERYRQPAQNDPLAPPSSEPQALHGSWRKANAERDVKTAMRFLKSLDNERFPEIKCDAAERGKLFLLTFDLQQRGDVTNAALLVRELFKRAEPWQKVIVDAMNLVADAQYENVYRKFRADHDWAAYRSGLKELVAKYPRGWLKGPGVQMLLTRVEQRLSPPYPAPSVTTGMNATDLTLAAKLMGLRAVRVDPDRYGAPKVLWLVPSAWREKIVGDPDAELEARGRGVEGIPFLLALAADGALTEVDRAEVSPDGGMSLPGITPGNAEDEKRSLDAFNSLRRPATRGELALHWLTEMVPEAFTGGQWNRKKDDELVEAIRTFYDKHHKDSDEDLAVLCLPGHYGGLNEAATDFLLKSASRKPVPAIDRYVLAKRNPEQDDDDESMDADDVYRGRTQLLVQYAAVRGAEVRPTVEKFIAQLRKAADEYKKPKNYGFQDAEQETKFIKEKQESLRKVAAGLARFPYGKTVEELIRDELNEQEPEGGYAHQVLMAKFESAPFPDVLGLLLKQAAATNTAHARAALAGMARQAAAGRAATGVKPTDHADPWKSLIADDRASSTNADRLVSDSFLILNEQLFASGKAAAQGDDFFSEYGRSREAGAADALIADYGRRGRELLRERARGRLSGTPEEKLPRYPDDEPLSPKGYAALKGKLAGVDGLDKLAEATEKLSIYERAALPELLRKEPTLNERLAAMANKVTKVTVDSTDEAFRTKLEAWRGKAFTPDLVRDLQDYCTAQARASRPSACLLSRKGDFAGCEVSVRSAVAPADEPDAEGEGKPAIRPIAGLTGLICGHGLYGAAVWRTAPPPAKDTWGNVETSEPDVIRDFQASAARLCGSDVAASEEAFAVFETKGDRQ